MIDLPWNKIRLRQMSCWMAIRLLFAHFNSITIFVPY